MFNKKIMKSILFVLAVFSTSFAYADGSVADMFANSKQAKFKEHNETKGQVPLSQPIALAIVAGLLIALPTFLSVAKGGVFGSGSQANTLSGQATRTIN